MHKLFLACITFICFCADAQAATVDFIGTAICPTCIVPDATIELVTTPQSIPGEFLVTNIIGNVGGFTPTVIAPGGWSSLNGTNDNLLFFPPNPGPYDLGGLGIALGGTATDLACLGAFCAVLYADPNAPLGLIHAATFQVSETPLPPALPLVGTGLAAVFLLGWLRTREAAAACQS
jgi:hypothetical protein